MSSIAASKRTATDYIQGPDALLLKEVRLEAKRDPETGLVMIDIRARPEHEITDQHLSDATIAIVEFASAELGFG